MYLHVCACASSGRTRHELHRTVGPFAQQIPLRFQLSDELTFAGLLEHAKSKVRTFCHFAFCNLPHYVLRECVD